MSIGMALRPHGATAAVLLEQAAPVRCWCSGGSHDRLVPVQVAQQVQRLRPAASTNGDAWQLVNCLP